MIPYGKQSIDESDIEAVLRILQSDSLTGGPEVGAFEQDVARLVGAKHAVAVCNATAALHLAMRVSQIGPGDRVVTSPNTFLASANSAAFVGATPDFVDIDPVSYNLDPEVLEANWRDDTKAVVAVDYAGQPANMPAIAKIARERGALVIEDACHGIGGRFSYQDSVWNVGGHPWADISTFSFHPVKTMTTGEGGMLVTDLDNVADRARLLRNHGMVRDSAAFGCLGSCPLTSEQGTWYYEMQDLGYNYRITELQCALGRSQLKRLTYFIRRRQEIVNRYNEAFSDMPFLSTPKLASWIREEGENQDSTVGNSLSWHLYTVRVDFAALGQSRTEVMTKLRNNGIGTQVLYIPVHLQPWYRNNYGYEVGKCPVAEDYYSQALSLPLYPAMSNDNIEHVILAVRQLLNTQ